jgi:hypothetical protein
MRCGAVLGAAFPYAGCSDLAINGKVNPMWSEQSEVLWTGMPAAVRERVDALVVHGKAVEAVLVVRDSLREAGVEPLPSLMTCRNMLAARTEQLADQVVALPPQDIDT